MFIILITHLYLKTTWKVLEEFVDKGVIKSLGVCNFSIEKTKRLQKHTRVPISAIQMEAHPLWRNEKNIKWHRENNI